MEELKIELTLLSQHVGAGAWLGELLLVPELATVDASRDSVWRGLTNLAEKFLADVPPGELWQRMVGAPVELLQLTLEMAPPKRSASWRHAARLTFHGVKWRRPEGTWAAYVPLVRAAAVAEKQADLPSELEREIRIAVHRANASADEPGMTLRSAALLARIDELVLEPVHVAVKVKTPKARDQDLSQEIAEKSVLQECAADLTQSPPATDGARGTKACEIRDVVEKIADALTGRNAACVLLVGPSGVGKTAAVTELVRLRDALGLGDRTFWETSGSRLVMGAVGYGMWQQRCHKFCREAARTRAIVYLGNLIELLEVGKSESNAIGIAGQLRGYMQRGQLLAIAECTAEQVAVLEREDPHLLATFRQVTMEEPSAEKLAAILQHVAADLTAGDPRRRGKDLENIPVVSADALAEIQRLHRRYATYSALPGRPIRFLRNLVNDSVGRQAEAGVTITPDRVTAAFARETGLPLMLLDDAIPLDTDAAREWFASRVLAQDAAVDAVVDLLATVKAALNRPRRPLASLLFIGPTGVGKTAMAKALAEYFFSDPARLTRFDMSEYATPAAVMRLVGGWRAEGLLTAKVRQQPFSVLLLDEVEKAHPAFFDLLLQVLGEARLTDAAGRLADFSNCIVVMTSNLGAASFGRVKFGLKEAPQHDASTHFVEEVRAFLRPELFNRLDRIVPFLPLDAEAIRNVARREVSLVKTRDGLRLRDAELQLHDDAVNLLAGNGFDPAYGARPLKRAIERELLAPLADALNGYDQNLAIRAAVHLDNGKLAVRARAVADQTETQRHDLGLAVARRASKLRRQVQRLEKSGAMLQLQNEVFQLQRRILHAEVSPKRPNPELPAWRDRLKRLRGPAGAVEALARETVTLEEEVLFCFYNRREIAENRPWLDELAVLDNRLSQSLLALFSLRYANADRLSVGIFGDKDSPVLQLARAYFAAAEKREFQVQLAWYKHDSRGLLRYREDSAKKYLAGASAKPRGIVLEIRGPSAAPLFFPEAGCHVFENQNKKSYCEVLTQECALTDLQPPPDLIGAPGTATIPAGPPRRTVDLFNHTAHDPHTEKQEKWQRFDELIDRLMALRLRQLIAEPLGEDA